MSKDVNIEIGLNANSSEAINEIEKSKKALDSLNNVKSKIDIDASNLGKVTEKTKGLANVALGTIEKIDGLNNSFKNVAVIGLGVANGFKNIIESGFNPFTIAITAVVSGLGLLITHLQKSKLSVEDLNNAFQGLTNLDNEIKTIEDLNNKLKDLGVNTENYNNILNRAKNTLNEINEKTSSDFRIKFNTDTNEILKSINKDFANNLDDLKNYIENYEKLLQDSEKFKNLFGTSKFESELKDITEKIKNTTTKLLSSENLEAFNKLKSNLKKAGIDVNQALNTILNINGEMLYYYNKETREVYNKLESILRVKSLDVEKMKEQLAKTEELKKKNEELKKQEQERLNTFNNAYHEAYKKALSLKDINEQMLETFEAVYGIIGSYQNINTGFFDDFIDSFIKKFETLKNETLTMSQFIGETVAEGLGAGVSNAAAVASDALYKYGEQINQLNEYHLTMSQIAMAVAKAMIKATLMEISTIAIKKGTFYLLEGGAKFFSSLFPPNPLGIKAGLGEMAKGTALIALGGGSAVAAGALTGGGAGSGGGHESNKESIKEKNETIINQTIEINGTYDNKSLEQTERVLKNIDNYIKRI
ncbi:MAG TPA: hypothetical protein P5250_00910 [Bacteroidales bacterium]|mgnify:FL=1|nr:hypothetical protein [Bacteroidales bacterium]